jgi:enamine deaminase RidA (YjgF/YER057c/UK114 family)
MVEHASGLHTSATLPRRKNGNVQALLATDELTMDNILSTTVFLENMNEFTKMNDVYE